MGAKLILVRHAKASHGGMRDQARPLASSGINQARRVAVSLAERLEGVKPVVISSPAVRARTTAAIIAETMGASVEEFSELYFGDEDDVLRIASNYAPATTIIVGHSPIIPIAASLIAAGDGANQVATTGCPTATAYIFDVPHDVDTVGYRSLPLESIIITRAHPAR
ncbi:MAG: histidine phosphatase family protein [Actinomycetaceae bacterium]|nr:histidine phosphatase family protein [Actinomycetaceae bacterium]